VRVGGRWRAFGLLGSVVMAGCSSPAVSAPHTASTTGPALISNDPARALITPTGVVTEVLGGSPGAWQVRTPCGATATVAAGKPITEATVVLDPGHGGRETGAIGSGELLEEHLNLAVAEAAKRALEAQGVTVLLTRTADYPVTISVRAALATAVKPKVFVSVHHNGGPSDPSSKPGTETYYQHASADARRIAGLLYEETLAFFSQYRGVRWRATALPGAKPQRNFNGEDYFGVLRRTVGVPTVLSEGLFLSASSGEAQLLAREDVQRGEGEAIARGIIRFLRTADPGSGFVESKPRGNDGNNAYPPCVDPALE
jgi:N-acetylmuramoyl-L-alanine amidase